MFSCVIRRCFRVLSGAHVFVCCNELLSCVVGGSCFRVL